MQPSMTASFGSTMRARGVPSGSSFSAFLAPLFNAPTKREEDVLQVRARVDELPHSLQSVEQDESSHASVIARSSCSSVRVLRW